MSEIHPSITVGQVERTSEGAPHLRAYPTYKDSGVPWLGDVPAHWEVHRQRNIVYLMVSNVDKHTHEGESPVRLCNYVDVYKNDTITDRIPFMRATASQEEINRFRLRMGDVVITKDSETWDDIGVPALVNYEAPDFVCGYHLAILRPRKDVIYGEYLLRALQSRNVAVQHYVAANGITRYGLSQDAIKSVWIPLPPLPEQRAIAAFLAHHDRLTRRYIHAQQRLIKLLTEQKQALIQQAVTRGLDPAAPLKDSGIAWLGKIPAHWETLRAKYVFREIDDRSATGSETLLSMSQKLGLVPSYRIEERRLLSVSYAGAKLCQIDDLVLNRLKAHLGVFALASEPGIVSPDYTVLRAARPICPRYFELILKTPACRTELCKRVKGIVQGFWRLYTEEFYGIVLPFPPLEEQRKIVEHLDIQLQSLNETITRIQRQITLIREYRTRLIADVVTGKLDVRGFEVGRTSESASHLDDDTWEDLEDEETDDAPDDLDVV